MNRNSVPNAPYPPLPVYPHNGVAVNAARGLKKTLYRLVPRHVLYPFVKELRLIPVKRRAEKMRREYANARDLLVNIGAGGSGHDGWVNMDYYPNRNINCLMDARGGLPFADESVRAIFTEHFFEHIDYTEEVPRFLSECRRVLQPGGVVRIIVPDAGRYLKAYANGDWNDFIALRNINAEHYEAWSDSQYNTRMEIVNAVFRCGMHRFAYDFETLEFLLQRYGFRQVTQQEFGRSMLPELQIDLPSRARESLYVEGVK